MTDIEKVLVIAGEAIGILMKHDPEEAARLFMDMSEVLLSVDNERSEE